MSPRTGSTRWEHPAVGVVAGSLLFGTSGTARSYAPGGVTTASIAAIRLLLGAIPLVLYAWATTRSQRLPRPTRWSLITGISMIVFQLAFFTSVDRCGVAVGTMLAIGSGPVVSTIGETLAGRRPQLGILGATSIALVGLAALVLGQSQGSSTSIDAFGVLCGVGAGGCYALYTVASKIQIERSMPGSWAMAWSFCIASIGAVPLLVLNPLGWVVSVRGATVGAYLGVFTIAAAYLLYAHSLRQLPSSTIVTLTLVEPVTAATLGALVLHEHLPAISWVGSATVCLGLVLVGRFTNA